jgi:hypothetical protein
MFVRGVSGWVDGEDGWWSRWWRGVMCRGRGWVVLGTELSRQTRR